MDKNKVQQLDISGTKKKGKKFDWITKEITSHKYSKKEMEELMLLLKKKDQEGAWKILLKGKDYGTCCKHHYNSQLAKVIEKEIHNPKKSKEEKAEAIINFCLDFLDQDINAEWKNKKNKLLILLTLTENECRKNKDWKARLEQAEQLTKLVEKEVEEAEHLRIKEATNLLFNNPKEFFKDVKRTKQ